MSASIKCFEDIEVGRIYRLSQTLIYAGFIDSNGTTTFKHKYHKWSDLAGKKILVLEKLTFNVPNCIKFAVYPINSPLQTRTDSSGDWCICSYNYLQQIPKKTKPTIECRCNIWITGCKCGVFKIEQAAK